jgi:ribosome-binding protein aMBF1 (putative translation factor)
MTRLKYERLKRGWSLQTLGYQAQVQSADVSKMERRIYTGYASQRERLARVLEIDAGQILEEVSTDEVVEVSGV